MKRYGIRHKETGKYYRDSHYVASGEFIDAAWLDMCVITRYRDAERIFREGRLGDVAELVEIIEQDDGEPTIRVIK